MTVITVPTAFSFTGVPKFSLTREGNTIRSRYSGYRQVITYPYAVWYLEGSLVDYDSTEARLIRSFLTKLEGQKNTFRLNVPGYSAPSTGYSGNALVNNGAGIAARATSMAVDGMTAGASILNEGDYFSVGDELKVATAAVTANGSGQATITFQPFLRKALADNAAVTFQSPTILMHSVDDDVATWGLSPPIRHAVKLRLIESIEL